jgi:hypothetical protein
VIGVLRGLNNEDLHNLYPSPSIIRTKNKEEWDGHVARCRKKEYIQDFGGKARRRETTRKNLCIQIVPQNVCHV